MYIWCRILMNWSAIKKNSVLTRHLFSVQPNYQLLKFKFSGHPDRRNLNASKVMYFFHMNNFEFKCSFFSVTNFNFINKIDGKSNKLQFLTRISLHKIIDPTAMFFHAYFMLLNKIYLISISHQMNQPSSIGLNTKFIDESNLQPSQNVKRFTDYRTIKCLFVSVHQHPLQIWMYVILSLSIRHVFFFDLHFFLISYICFNKATTQSIHSKFIP